MSQGNITQVNMSQSEIMIKHVIMTLETNKIICFFLLVLEQFSFKNILKMFTIEKFLP